MRFMILIKADANTEAGALPDTEPLTGGRGAHARADGTPEVNGRT
jgi:hypothetical protein